MDIAPFSVRGDAGLNPSCDTKFFLFFFISETCAESLTCKLFTAGIVSLLLVTSYTERNVLLVNVGKETFSEKYLH